MAVVTLDEVKTFLSITTTAKDDLIDALIPEVQGFIVQFCRSTFLDSEGAEDWPAGMKKIASKMIGWDISTNTNSGMSSESQGGYSYTKETTLGGYPTEIIKGLGLFRKASFKSGQLLSQAIDRRGISVEQLAKDEFYFGYEGDPI